MCDKWLGALTGSEQQWWWPLGLESASSWCFVCRQMRWGSQLVQCIAEQTVSMWSYTQHTHLAHQTEGSAVARDNTVCLLIGVSTPSLVRLCFWTGLLLLR